MMSIMKMKCKKCGAEIPVNSLFCPFCGEPVKSKAKKTGVVLLLVLLLLVCVGAVSIFFLRNSQTSLSSNDSGKIDIPDYDMLCKFVSNKSKASDFENWMNHHGYKPIGKDSYDKEKLRFVYFAINVVKKGEKKFSPTKKPYALVEVCYEVLHSNRLKRSVTIYTSDKKLLESLMYHSKLYMSISSETSDGGFDANSKDDKFWMRYEIGSPQQGDLLDGWYVLFSRNIF